MGPFLGIWETEVPSRVP